MSIRTFKIDVEIYHYSFYVCIGNVKESLVFINELNGLPNEKEVGYKFKDLNNYAGGVFSNKGKPTILWLPKIPRTSEELSNLSHEIFHIVCHITRWVTLPLSITSEEAYCYLIGWMTKQFWLELKK